MSGELQSQLALIKVHALTHDPPHKSFLIKKYGQKYHEQHKVEASRFRQAVFENYRLSQGLGEDLRSLVNEADRLASSFDRWILNISRWPKSTYLSYDRLHNVFNPEVVEELGGLNENAIDEVIRDLRNAVTAAYKAGNSEMFAYNTFFALYEAYWYYHGLPPSLADTRVPTHTVFDHLYATATVSNLFVEKGSVGLKKSSRPTGYFVVVDVPGVQPFINASRKAGDFWASSWILSNMVWSVIEHFALRYGFDIVVSPSPRLNPYTLRSIVNASIYGFGDPSFRLVFEQKTEGELDKIAADVYTNVFGVDFKEAWLQPIVPATALFVVPRIDHESPGELVSEVVKVYNESWRKLVDQVESGLDRSDLISARYWKNKLFEGNIKNIIMSPPKTPFVAVVDVGEAYEKVVDCLRNLGSCSEIGLRVKSEIKAILEERRIDVEDLAKSLLWHVLVNSWKQLLRVGAGEVAVSVPRPFWEYDSSSKALKPLGDYCDYVNCALCGDEPAVIKVTKSVKDGEVVFSEEFVNEVKKVLGTSGEVINVKRLEEELSKVVKPGEALGPYCAFKRVLYMTLSGKLRIVSTDDVALAFLTNSLNKLSRDGKESFYEKVVSEASKLGVKLDVNDLEYLFGENTQNRDLYFMARIFNVPEEKFTSALSEAMKRACRDTVKAEVFEKLVKPGLPEFVKELVEAPDKVCDVIALKTKFAIIRGDADDVGKVLRGEKGKSLNEVAKVLLDHVVKWGEFEDNKEEALNALKDGYSAAAELAEALGLKSSPISPAITSSTSLSLMLTSLEDWRILRERGGLLIYSGGDDVMALVPAENAIDVAIELREAFYKAGFKKVKGSPVISEIPTGRSFSIRFVSLLDVLSEESKVAQELLEEKAKKAKWVKDDTLLSEKDSLVVSSSRGGSISVFSLKPVSEERCELKGLLDALKAAQPLLLTFISSNLPEDFENFKEDALMENNRALKKVLEYVISRNIQLARQGSSVKPELAKWLAERLAIGAWLRIYDVKEHPVEVFLDLLRTLRWVF